MRCCAFILTVAALVASSGCSGGPEAVPLSPAGAVSAQPGASAAPGDPWDLVASLPVKEAERTKYVAASEARKCPSLTVTTVMGNEMRLKPGQSGFVEPGNVTLIVFWSMEFLEGKAAARHVSDLVRKYRELGVKAVGIVERTRLAPTSQSFAAQERLLFPMYYDTLDALKTMRKAIGAEGDLGYLVAVFIVDRQMRVRFWRGQFPFSAQIKMTPRPGKEEVEESASPGHAIEDYLKIILNEPY